MKGRLQMGHAIKVSPDQPWILALLGMSGHGQNCWKFSVSIDSVEVFYCCFLLFSV